SALATDPTFSNFSTTSTGRPIKNSLSRQQYGRRHRRSHQERQNLPVCFLRRSAAEFAEFRSSSDRQFDIRRPLLNGYEPFFAERSEVCTTGSCQRAVGF